jgi:hypothetical protein
LRESGALATIIGNTANRAAYPFIWRLTDAIVALP